jgi:serine/threonine protein kinase
MALYTSLPGYELLEVIHESAASCVFSARRKADGATVVVKRSLGDAASARQLTRYLNEYELLSSLACADVVAVHDLVRHEGHVALVLANCEGIPLRRFIETRTRWDLGECLHIALALAKIVEAVHARTVRSLKLRRRIRAFRCNG